MRPATDPAAAVPRHARRARWRWLIVAALALAVGCDDSEAAKTTRSVDVDAAVVALADAHDALVGFDAAAAEAPEAAIGDWPAVEQAVDDAVTRLADTDGLAPRQRSALVGFRRGLQVARDAYADVVDAVEHGDLDAVDDALATARQRLDALANLRDGLPSPPR